MDKDRTDSSSREEGWTETGRGPRGPVGPEAPDNVDTVPPWLWAMAAGAVAALGGGVLIVVLGAALLGVVPALGPLAICVGSLLAIAGLGMGLYAGPMVLLALDRVRRRGGV